MLSSSTVKHPFKVSFGITGYGYEENHKWGKFNADVIDWGSLKLDVKLGETLI
jgi:hypothetical protein